jgi:hypothetical protein
LYATWNAGIVECWNTGSEERKKVYFTIKCCIDIL